MIDEHTTRTLEFPKIISLIEGKCLTPYGKAEVARIAPMLDKELIERRLLEVSQMKDIINFGTMFPLYRVEHDCVELLRRSQVEGSFLDPPELLLILGLVKDSIGLHEYDKEGRVNFGLIAEYLTHIRAYPELKAQITRAVDEDGAVRDNASPKLKSVRYELTDSRRKIVNRLQTILTRRVKQAGWQDDVVAQRNDRYVIPIPSSQYQGDVGILHDRSQSGATLYVEPKETVELNNRINLLMQEERLEIDRILRALTAEVALRAEPLIENTRLIGQLDRIHACANLSRQIDGNRPVIVEDSSIELVNARHPMLIVQMGEAKNVVPTSISLDEHRPVVLVTGPNTGGKTVTLKTIGLSVLMARCGLHIPADEKSRIGFFRRIHADIGDEQSIELSLSTFSSHVGNIIRGLNDAAPDSLLLFDEIGAGTDPKEGSALAEAIILHAIDKGARLVATTHYSQLKTLAMEHPEVENASLEFDRETLAPTYRLHLGIPGSSYAVEIAGRLGMPDSICEKAAALLGTGEKSLANLIASLEAELSRIKEDRKKLSDRLAKAEQLEEYYREQLERLGKEVESEKKEALDETASYLKETRQEIERLVAEIRQTRASKKAVRDFHKNLQERQRDVSLRREKLKPQAADNTIFRPGDAVLILSLDREGEIEQLVGRNKAKVKVGNVTTTVELRNLRKTDSAVAKRVPKKVADYSLEETVSPEIHLLGMTAEEALESLERYLGRAVIAGLHQVYVIHGKGTGTLRRVLTKYLNNHPEVLSLRLGNWNEGGAGVTVVKLKE